MKNTDTDNKMASARKQWRKEAVKWLRRFRKTNHYSHWENYRSAKHLSS